MFKWFPDNSALILLLFEHTQEEVKKAFTFSFPGEVSTLETPKSAVPTNRALAYLSMK